MARCAVGALTLVLVALAALAPAAQAARPVPGWDGRGETACRRRARAAGSSRSSATRACGLRRWRPTGRWARPPSCRRRRLPTGSTSMASSPRSARTAPWRSRGRRTGERPITPDGIGFARRVIAASWQWGQPPPPAKELAAGVVELLGGLDGGEPDHAALAYAAPTVGRRLDRAWRCCRQAADGHAHRATGKRRWPAMRAAAWRWHGRRRHGGCGSRPSMPPARAGRPRPSRCAIRVWRPAISCSMRAAGRSRPGRSASLNRAGPGRSCTRCAWRRGRAEHGGSEQRPSPCRHDRGARNSI